MEVDLYEALKEIYDKLERLEQMLTVRYTKKTDDEIPKPVYKEPVEPKQTSQINIEGLDHEKLIQDALEKINKDSKKKKGLSLKLKKK